MNTTTKTQALDLTHIDSVRSTYSENTTTCKLILGVNDETYFNMVSDLGFKFLKKHQLFDQLKANPLFWNWVRMRICKAERMFLKRFDQPEKRGVLMVSYRCLVEFEVMNSLQTQKSFETYLKIIRNENLG